MPCQFIASAIKSSAGEWNITILNLCLPSRRETAQTMAAGNLCQGLMPAGIH